MQLSLTLVSEVREEGMQVSDISAQAEQRREPIEAAIPSDVMKAAISEA